MASKLDFFEYTDDLRAYTPQIKSGVKIDDLLPFFRPQRERMINLIGQTTYDAILAYYTDSSTENDILATALSYIQGALANFTAIPYFIFEAAERSNTDNNLYRYQEDKQIETYLEFAWTELNSLLSHLEDNIATFTDFANTDSYKLRSTLFIKNSAQFKRYYGAINSSYFYNNTIYLHEEIQKQEIISRIPDFPTITGDNLEWLVGKAMVYLVLSKACIQLDYTELPKSIRSDIISERSNKKSNESDIKNVLSNDFKVQGDEFLRKIEFEMNKQQNSDVYVESTDTLLESDKFYMPGI